MIAAAAVVAALATCAITAGVEEVVYFPVDMSGPTCDDVRQRVECGCSECMTWDLVGDAMAYEIERETVSNATRITVGRVDVEYIADGIDVTAVHPTVWCFVDDRVDDTTRFPRDGTLYAYRVRACKLDNNCGLWSTTVLYRAAPYACYADGGRERQCYVGDDIASVP
jgi:hypothetical protein